MKTINELIKMGFTPSILEGNIKLHYRGTASPDITRAKTLIEELKLHKDQGISYIENLVIYEIYNDSDFDTRIQACHDLCVKNIEWLQKIYVFEKANKIILIGKGNGWIKWL